MLHSVPWLSAQGREGRALAAALPNARRRRLRGSPARHAGSSWLRSDAIPLTAKGSLTLNSCCAQKRKESDTLIVPHGSHDLNPISVFNYLYFLIKIENKTKKE